MQRKWKSLLKRVSVILLLVAILAQTAGTYAYAGAGVSAKEYQGTEYQTKDREDEKNTEETEKSQDTKNTQ